MKISEVHIDGFMAIGSAVLGLADRGLVLIQGENKDDNSASSNGSGKSTLPDAISWCLYGVTARGESGDDIINTTCKSAKVSVLILDDDGATYRITRFRKDKIDKNRVYLFKDLKAITLPVDLTLGTDKETQLRINQVIGCDVDVFNAAIYQGQECIPDMPNMSDKQIKNLIERAAGIEVLEGCYKIALVKKNDAEKTMSRRNSELNLSVANLDNIRADILELEACSDEWQARHSIKQIEADKLVDEAEAVKDEWLDKVERQKKNVIVVKANIEKHKAILSEKAECDRYLASLVAVEHEHSTALRLAQNELSRTKSALENLQNKLGVVSSRIGSDCSECGKEIFEADLKSVMAGIGMQIDKKSEELKRCVEDVKDATSLLEASKSRACKYSDEMPDYTETAEQMSKCNIILAKIETLRVEARGYEAAFVSMRDARGEIDAEENPHDARLNKRLLDVKSYEEKVKEISKLHKADKSRFEMLTSAAEVYSPAGVRAHILDHVTPFLNARTAHYLSALSDGNLSAEWSTISMTKKKELREKFCIEVSNMTGGKKFGLLSGGEKRKVRLSCAMALQDVVSGRTTKPIELFMADEIDDALDPSGLERLMSILEEKARERGTVLVISHNSLGDWIRDVAVVTKEGGVATISGALSV